MVDRPEELLRTIADLRRELAQARAERDAFKADRDEALGREAAMAEVMGVSRCGPSTVAAWLMATNAGLVED